jgi:hypothetical protein
MKSSQMISIQQWRTCCPPKKEQKATGNYKHVIQMLLFKIESRERPSAWTPMMACYLSRLLKNDWNAQRRKMRLPRIGTLGKRSTPESNRMAYQGLGAPHPDPFSLPGLLPDNLSQKIQLPD